MSNPLTLSFWGTRGSYPQSGTEYMETGGHTSCVSLQTPEHILFFDAGTGLVKSAPSALSRQHKDDKSYHFLLSHMHIDHIFGIPFFSPLWDPQTHIHFYTGMLGSSTEFENTLSTIFSPPYFPVPWKEIPATRTYHTFRSGKSFNIDSIFVHSVPLFHPGGATGYRVEIAGRSIVYLTDTCHPLENDDIFVKFCSEADFLIYDATFTPESWAQHKDWGHSTWYQGCQLAQQSNVQKLVLFHHAPEHTDTTLKQILEHAQAVFPETLLAYDGLHISL